MRATITSAEYKSGYVIELKFSDGSCGCVDFAEYPGRGGVFSRFEDLEFFRRFEVDSDFGVLKWPDDIDIAPETLYAKATGKPLPEWIA
ncbi:MAG: DUF2442 domain-containing protein [Phycisphaerae bacterium]|jgi:hypothetical protein